MFSRRRILAGVGGLVAAPAIARSARNGGAAPLSANMSQFYDRLLTVPLPAVQLCYENLIVQLTPDGTFSACDLLVMCAVDDPGNSLVNIANGLFKPSLYLAAGSPSWTQYQGWTCIGINANIDPGFNPSGGINFQRNSAMVAVWSGSPLAGNTVLWRTEASLNIECWPKFNGNTLSQLNSSGEDLTANAADTSGLFMTNRTDASTYRLLRNNSLMATISKASVAPENSALKIGVGPFQVMGFAITGKLTTGQETTLYSGMYNFFHDSAIGAV